MGFGRIAVIVVVVLAAEIVVVGGGIAWYLFSGRWTVAASEPHLRPVRWAAERVYRASVEGHAKALPIDAIANADVAAGGRLYAENCARCHAAPGGERPAWAEGMRPVPPHLPREGTPFEPGEIAWLLRHGIKMSGMPAWGNILADRQLLDVAAFVDALPISAESYAQMLQTEEEERGAQEAVTSEADPAQPEAEAVEAASVDPAPSAAAPSGEEEEAATAEAGPSQAEAVDGDEGAASPAQPQAGEDAEPAATVEMTNALTYQPATVTVKVGDTVRWTNPSDVRHTVTADESKANDPSHVVLPEGAEPFDSGNIEPGGAWDHTFRVAGRYKYFCIPHEGAGMIGEVVVED